MKDVDKIEIFTMWGFSEIKQYEKYLGLSLIVGR